MRGQHRQTSAPRLTEAELTKKLQSSFVKRKVFKILFILSIPLSPTLFFLIGFTFRTELGAFADWSIAVGILPIFFFAFMMDRYKDNKKALVNASNIVHDMLAENFDLITYQPDQFFDAEQLQESQLTGWNTYHGSDYFKAEYRGVKFSFSDINLRLIANAGRHQTEAFIFTGQWMIIDLNKPVKSPVIVSELRSKSTLSALSEVQMENVAFNEQFSALTEDPHTAFYVLTPQFMENILSAREHAYGKKHMCFTRDRVHVAIDTGCDFFEARKNISALKARVQSEIDYIKNIIDEFLLNERLFNPREAIHGVPSDRSSFKPPRAKAKIRKVLSTIFIIWTLVLIASIVVAIISEAAFDNPFPLGRTFDAAMGVLLWTWVSIAFIRLVLWIRRKLIKATMNLDI